MTKFKTLISNTAGHTAKSRLIFLVSFIFLLLICMISVSTVWYLSMEQKEEEALRMTEVAKAGFSEADLRKLDYNKSDLLKREYIEVKEGLQQIVAASEDIRFAYIFAMRDDRLYFAADSEPESAENYSPPGQEYTEAGAEDKQPFYDGKPIILKSKDRWGTWISVLSPMRDSVTGELIAVFGVDYTETAWYRQAMRNTIQAGVIAASLLFVFLSLSYVLRSNFLIRREQSKHFETNSKLHENERSFSLLLSNLPGMAYRCKYDVHWTMLFVSEGCLDLTGYSASSLVNNRDVTYSDIISPRFRDVLWEKWIHVIEEKGKLAEEYEIITASGEARWVFEQGQAIFESDGSVSALEGLIIDITDRKRKEDEIQYLNNHDFLTGIYNRRFLELMKVRMDRGDFLPLSVIIGDINGVKLVNDALGHAEGDKLIIETAKIIQKCTRENDIAARTGGDEFTILLPFTDKETASDRMSLIREECERYNRKLFNEAYSLNISLGFATKEKAEENLDNTIKLAEDFMYKRKLLEHKSSHSVILSSIKATMHEKSHETQEHAERLTYLAKEIGRKLKLTQLQMDELELVAMLHDIGKVGVDDRILNKPGKLNDEEWVEMKKHSEIGYRIAMSSPDLVAVADFILYLHERWDGRGYPQGIAGEEIPLLSRIVSVVDAYDAMTENRPYRKAMSEEEASAEIRRNAGIQFDPKIVKVFLDKVLNVKYG